MNATRINGIRVGHQMYYLRCARDMPGKGEDLFPILTRAKMNLPFLVLSLGPSGRRVFCCLEAEANLNLGIFSAATLISVFPHGSRTRTLGLLIELFAQRSIPFYSFVSSTAMVTFAVATADCDRVLLALEQTFDLPACHTPYTPAFQEEVAVFVRKRYQETRAYFQETRIKTYGFDLKQDIGLQTINCPGEELVCAGSTLVADPGGFDFSTGFKNGDGWHLSLLSRDEGKQKTDLVTFQGPHFGDRFGIFDTALTCLSMEGLTPILAGATGASISLVFKAGEGRAAVQSLNRGFETP